MSESHIEPKSIEIDIVENGSARLLCHWDTTTIERTDEMSNSSQTYYQYSEEILWWVLPRPFVDRVSIEKYLSSNESEIIAYAKAKHGIEVADTTPDSNERVAALEDMVAAIVEGGL